MAITYLSGERIQGSSTAQGSITNTKTFDYSNSTNWELGNSGTGANSITITGGEVAFNAVTNGGSNHRISYDLQTNDSFTMSDTAWVLDFEMEGTAQPTTGNSSSPIGFSYTDDATITGSQDRIVTEYSGTGSNWSIGTKPYENVGHINGMDLNTVYYIRVERINATNVRISVFTDSARTTHQTSGSNDSPSLVTNANWADHTGLRWLVHSSYEGSDGNRNSTYNIDNVTIYNGAKVTGDYTTNNAIGTIIGATTTDEKATITDVPVGTRYEETDTRKIYRRALPVDLTDLKAYFTMNEASGKLINTASTIGSTDAIANFDLTNNGATQDVTGKIGKCVSFSGNVDIQADDSNLTDTAFLSNNGAVWTVCVWVKPEGLGSGGNIIGDQMIFSTSARGTGDNGIWFRIGATVAPPNNPAVIAMSLGTEGTDAISGTNSQGFEDESDPTGWNFLCCQYDDATGIARASLNDKTFNNIFTGANMTTTTTPNYRFMVGNNSIQNNDMNGDIDELSLWNRILTSAEITKIYNAGSGKLLGAGWTEKGTA